MDYNKKIYDRLGDIQSKLGWALVWLFFIVLNTCNGGVTVT